MSTSATVSEPKLALVLPAGGARAAYQVGVLSYLAEQYPALRPTIFTGISAGSINACFLAQGDPFAESAARMNSLWSTLDFTDVFATNFRSLYSMVGRWVSDLFVSKVTHRLLLRSLLDASPLAGTLLTHVHFWKIARALRQRQIHGISVTATNYHTGSSTIFYDSSDAIEPWTRQDRVAIRGHLRVRHIMASCSIPILFEPVRIGDHLYGDGSLRYNFPFSPAIHLGATHVLGISIRPPAAEDLGGYKPDQLNLGFIAGAVMNSVFLDSLEPDYESVLKMNRLSAGGIVRTVTPLLLRPSQDLASLSKDHLKEVPFHFRQLLRSTANPEELGNLLSYLLFSPGYLSELIRLGRKDADTARGSLETFVRSLT
jgi:NTE family protein